MNNGLVFFITAIILTSCFFDLKTRKIPNIFNIIVALSAIPLGLYLFGLTALYSFLIIALALLPVYILGALGGGDYKLFCALSFLIPYESHFEVLLYTIMWAALYGSIKLVSRYNFNDWVYQLYLDAKYAFQKTNDNFRVPLTIPYLLGWLSLLKLGGAI